MIVPLISCPNFELGLQESAKTFPMSEPQIPHDPKLINISLSWIIGSSISTNDIVLSVNNFNAFIHSLYPHC
jgi:hypothetical protein